MAEEENLFEFQTNSFKAGNKLSIKISSYFIFMDKTW